MYQVHSLLRTVDAGRLLAAALAIAATTLLGGTPRMAQAALAPPAIPELEPGAGIIRDKAAALALGKALFFDEQAGSDGAACASCHFSAGADSAHPEPAIPGLKDITAGRTAIQRSAPSGRTLAGRPG